MSIVQCSLVRLVVLTETTMLTACVAMPIRSRDVGRCTRDGLQLAEESDHPMRQKPSHKSQLLCSLSAVCLMRYTNRRLLTYLLSVFRMK